MIPMSLAPRVESPFEVLSVDPDADDDAVKAAYRERVKDAHPDHGGSPEEFQLVKTAYEEIKAGYEPEEAAFEDGSEETDDPESDRGGRGVHVESQVEYLNYEILDDHGWSLNDDDLFEKAASVHLDSVDYGRIWVQPRESLLEAAERHDFAWPYACRGGACANCAVLVVDGEMETRVDHVLPPEMVEQGYQLSCNGMPTTPEMRVVYNIKHVSELEDLLLPPRPWEQAHSD
jgi:ferredoxin